MKFTHKFPDGTRVTVYHSLEEFGDPWTAVIKGGGWDESANVGYKAMLGMSDYPTSYSGISQFSEGKEGSHLGKKIPWNKVPKNLREHIEARIMQ